MGLGRELGLALAGVRTGVGKGFLVVLVWVWELELAGVEVRYAEGLGNGVEG